MTSTFTDKLEKQEQREGRKKRRGLLLGYTDPVIGSIIYDFCTGVMNGTSDMKFPQGPPSISMIGFPTRKEYLLQSEAVRCQQKIKKPLTTYGNMVTTVILRHLLMGSAFDKTEKKTTNSSEATTTCVRACVRACAGSFYFIFYKKPQS